MVPLSQGGSSSRDGGESARADSSKHNHHLRKGEHFHCSTCSDGNTLMIYMYMYVGISEKEDYVIRK